MHPAPARKMPAWFEWTAQAFIVISIVSMCLETMPSLSDYSGFFWVVEVVTVSAFTNEYVVRWGGSGNVLAFPLRSGNIVDLLAIAPFYLALGTDLRGLRVFRLLRMGRILGLRRYNSSLRTFQEAIREVMPELVTFSCVGVGMILVSAMALYYAEHDAQPDVYTSIPATLWWAVVTLKTVGYGDAYPVTILGRMVASMIMLVGIGLVAVPTSLLSAAMTDAIRRRRADAEKDVAGCRQAH